MRRRLIRMGLAMVVLPLAIRLAESSADRLEAVNGPSTGSNLLRRGSAVARRYARR